jgi:hypothetical protein
MVVVMRKVIMMIMRILTKVLVLVLRMVKVELEKE